MKTRTSPRNAALIALLAATVSAQADDYSADRFVMAVYEDMAQGRAILDGSPTRSIDALTSESAGRTASFEASVNLCVAYTQVKRIDDAAIACDAAVAKAEKQIARTRSHSPYFSTVRRKAQTNQAIALSNRAVVHALSGERHEARALLETAVKMDPKKKFARSNLARVEQDLAARL